jgi:integrase
MGIEDLPPKEDWLREYSRQRTIKKCRRNFGLFCEWADTNDLELVNEYKTSDPREFSKKWGKIIVQYYNDMLKKGYSSNYCRTLTIAPRAFFKSQCIEVKIKRGAIAKQKMAMGEHEFILEELQKMYRVGDIEDKARLATALTLGWGAQDFLNLEWSFIEPYLDENLEPPVAFWYERGKTGAPSRSHLTHEAIDALREWKRVSSESKYVFSGYNGTHLTPNALNVWLKSLVKRAKIKARGKIRFHLMRKFLFSQLSSSGMNAFESKLCIGKTIPADLLTYLKGQEENLREKFIKAESRFTLTGITNSHYGNLTEFNEKLMTLEAIITDQEKERRKQDIKIDVLTDSLVKLEETTKQQKEEIIRLLKTIARNEAKKVFEGLEEAEEMDE